MVDVVGFAQSPMPSRENLLENFAGNLEYHPRRAAIYFVLGLGAACVWFFWPMERTPSTVPLIFAAGSISLIGKGIFLMRRSSEGIGLSDSELRELSSSARQKSLPSLPEQAAQVLQDFGTGGLLLWPMVKVFANNKDWSEARRLPVFVWGLVLFGLGWMIRRLTQEQSS